MRELRASGTLRGIFHSVCQQVCKVLCLYADINTEKCLMHYVTLCGARPVMPRVAGAVPYDS